MDLITFEDVSLALLPNLGLILGFVFNGPILHYFGSFSMTLAKLPCKWQPLAWLKVGLLVGMSQKNSFFLSKKQEFGYYQAVKAIEGISLGKVGTGKV